MKVEFECHSEYCIHRQKDNSCSKKKIVLGEQGVCKR